MRSLTGRFADTFLKTFYKLNVSMLVMFLSVETLFANVIMLLKACPCGFVPYFINNKKRYAL